MEEINTLKDLFSSVELEGKKLILDGIPYTETEFKNEAAELLVKLKDSKASELALLSVTPSTKAEFKQKIRAIWYRTIEELAPKEEAVDIKMLPFIDYTTGNKKVLNVAGLNDPHAEVEDIVTDMHLMTYYASLPSKKIAEEMRYNLDYCKFIYNPYDLRTKYFATVDKSDILHINMYKKPAWRKVAPNEDNYAGQVFIKLLKHLIPDRTQREFTGVWIYRAIFKRNHTFLMLRGMRGNGKTTLLQIVAALTGASLKAQEDFFTTTFNAVLRNKRFVYKDEGDYDKSANNRFKSYLNKTAGLQGKHKEVEGDVELFASFAMAQNLEDRNYHLVDERKKSQPDLVNKKLDKIMDYKDRKFLNKDLLESPEDLAVIGNYIQEKYNPEKYQWTDTDPLKGEQYWLDVIDSLPPFYKILVEKIISREEEEYSPIDIQKLADKEKFNKPKRSQPPRGDRLKKWAESFYWKEMEDPICTIEKDDSGEWVIIPHEEFMPEDKE